MSFFDESLIRRGERQQLERIEHLLHRILRILEHPVIHLTASFAQGVVNMPNLLEKVGVADTATVVATSTDRGVVTITQTAVSDNPAVLPAPVQNPDLTWGFTGATAGTCNLTFGGTDPGGETVVPLVFAVTVASSGQITLTAKFASGVVS